LFDGTQILEGLRGCGCAKGSRPNNGLGLEIPEAANSQGESPIRHGGRETRVLLLLGIWAGLGVGAANRGRVRLPSDSIVFVII
jgi:hypothetical protein